MAEIAAEHPVRQPRKRLFARVSLNLDISELEASILPIFPNFRSQPKPEGVILRIDTLPIDNSRLNADRSAVAPAQDFLRYLSDRWRHDINRLGPLPTQGVGVSAKEHLGFRAVSMLLAPTPAYAHLLVSAWEKAAEAGLTVKEHEDYMQTTHRYHGDTQNPYVDSALLKSDIKMGTFASNFSLPVLLGVVPAEDVARREDEWPILREQLNEQLDPQYSLGKVAIGTPIR